MQVSTENDMIKRKELSPYRSIQSRVNQENTRSFSQNSQAREQKQQFSHLKLLEDKDYISFQPSLGQIKNEDTVLRDHQQQVNQQQRTSLKGHFPLNNMNPMLSVSGDRNSLFQKEGNPPHLLHAHTLNNASRLTSSRQYDQSPDVKMLTQLPVLTSDGCATPTDYSNVHNNTNEGITLSMQMIKQRSLNALNTNLPTTAPVSNLGARHLSTNSSNTTP